MPLSSPTLHQKDFILWSLNNYICQIPIFKKGYILRLQVNVNFGRTLSNPLLPVVYTAPGL